MLIVRCSSCQTQYRVDPARLGPGRRKLKCAKCGTVFPVDLPAEEAQDAPVTGPPPAPAPRGERRLDVAVVGMEPGPSRQLVTASLGRCGIRFVTADDGPGALEAARRSRPRLVVLDGCPRGLSADEIIEALRAEPPMALTRIVLVGAAPPGGKYALSPARRHVVDACVEQLDAQELEALVRALLEREGGGPDVHWPEDALAATARVAVSDLLAYNAEEVDRALREGRLSVELHEQVAESREWCVAAHPVARHAASPAGAAFDAEWARALEARRSALGLPDGPLPA